MSQKTVDVNLNTLAQANELASKVIANVAGEAVSTTLNGEIVTNSQLKHAVAAKMQGCLLTGKGGEKS